MKVGIYNRWLATMGGGERYTLAIAAHLAKVHEVTVISHAPADAAELAARLHLDLSGVTFRAVWPRPPDEMGPVAAEYDLFINASNQDFVPPQAKRNAMVVYFPAVPPAGPGPRFRRRIGRVIRRAASLPQPVASLYRTLFEEVWPGVGLRLMNPLPVNLRAIAAGYDLIWAISQYTRRWIDAYWHLPSTVLYPPVDVAQFAPHSKRPQILSVGRFFAGQHNKKHLVMVEQFRQMADAGLGGWELHLAGGSTPGAAHEDYLRRVRAAAAGYPIRIYVDLAFERLVELVGASSIYWHASGYGESEALHPVKFEHFGITAVEAMAAGCAPVLIGRGGLAELVRHGEDGYLWYTTDELRRHTRRLMDDAFLRSRIAQAAMVRSRRFDLPIFEADLDRSLAPLLNG